MTNTHICLVLAGTETGGLERHVGDLANGLAATFHVSVVAHEVHRDRFDPQVEFCPVDLQRWRYNPIMLTEAAFVLRRLNPSIVHAHGRKAGTIVGTLRKLLSAHVVLTLHSIHRSASISRLTGRFDAVIGVSSAVLGHVAHPRKFLVHNGNG